MKIFIAVTRKQALEAAKTLQTQGEVMVVGVPGEEIRILGIEVHDTVPEQRMVPRGSVDPDRHDRRLPPGWRDRVKESSPSREPVA